MNLFPQEIASFSSRLLDWYEHNRRELPWRSRPEPYPVWLSEVMLQQTQVGTALPYFCRFLDRYPDLASLARAEENEILGEWSGLGYYSRARNLHRAARLICERHDGRFPLDFDEAMALPGVGRYTAGAVLSIACGQPHPVLDGNVKRVLARYLCLREELTGRRLNGLWELLSGMVQHPAVAPRVADFNQALMELGALVCTPQNPRCERCPLAEGCRAFRTGLQHELPVKRKARPATELHFLCLVVRRGQRFLMRQNDEGSFLKGFWEFPKVEGKPGLEGAAPAHNLKAEPGRVLSPIVHCITHRRIHFHPVLAHLARRPQGTNWRWLRIGEPGYPISAWVRKIAAAVGTN